MSQKICAGFVLDDVTPEEVARAKIESGLQKQPFHIFDVDEAHSRIQHFKKMMPRKMTGEFRNGSTKCTDAGFVLDDVTPEEVARAMIESGLQKQPFHIFDVDEAHSRIQHFKKMMPRVQICYAIKANDYEMMLKLAISQGLGFDCASPGEIKKIIELGADPRSIIYAIPSKMPDEMLYAKDAGVSHTTFDTYNELKKIKQYWPDASLVLRIRVDSTSIYELGKKFGCDFETEASTLLDQAASLGLRVVGVAFHVGSVCFSPESYEVGLRNARALFDYESCAGRRMTLLDIGGGFLSDRTDRIDEVAHIVNDIFEELFPDPNIQITAEPGRYLCDSSSTLYCNLNNVRTVTENDKKLSLVYMNDGIYGTLRFTEPWHTVRKLTSSNKIEEVQLGKVTLFGPSGDNMDAVMTNRDVHLPECTPADWLVFHIQGAYTTNFATQFSCLPLPLKRPVVSRELWNNLKASAAFSSTDFIEDPDVSAPLPSTMPSLPRVAHRPSQNTVQGVILKNN